MSTIDMNVGYENAINYYYFCKNFNDYVRSVNEAIEKKNSRLLHRLFSFRDDHLKPCDVDDLIEGSILYAKQHGVKLPSDLEPLKGNLKEDLKSSGLKLDGKDLLLSVTSESLIFLSSHFKDRDEKLLTNGDYRKAEEVCLSKMRVPVVKIEKSQDM